MKVQCKFQCNCVTKRAEWNNSDAFVYEAEFSAVTTGSEENKEFFKYTPNGSLKVGVYKDDLFQPGKFYYINIEEAS